MRVHKKGNVPVAKKEKNSVDAPAPLVIEDAAHTSMDSLTQAEEFPRPDEEAIAAITAQNAEKPMPENDGQIFDPAIHRVGDDGKPSVTKTGKFRKKTGLKFIRPEDKKKEEVKTGIPEISSKDAAIVTSGLIEQISVKLIGDEFNYNEMERNSNVQAWERTYDHYGGVNLSPPAALALNHMSIILARSTQPQTISKMKLFGAWIKSKMTRKKKHGSQSDSRNDGKRKDDLGAEKGSLVTAP